MWVALVRDRMTVYDLLVTITGIAVCQVGLCALASGCRYTGGA